MYNPQTGTLILGDEMYGKSICSSHAQEFHASQAEGRFDDYLRGWIGVSKSYPHGIVHFAPAVSMEPVSYTHLDVYKRQAQECCVRNTDNASFLQFHDRNSIRQKKDSDITGIVGEIPDVARCV